MLSKTKHHLITGSRYPREQRTQRRPMARANGSTSRQHSCCSSQQTAAVPRNFIEGEEKSWKNSRNPPGMEICWEDERKVEIHRNCNFQRSYFKKWNVQSSDELLGMRTCLTVADKGHGEYGKPDTQCPFVRRPSGQPIRSEISFFPLDGRSSTTSSRARLERVGSRAVALIAGAVTVTFQMACPFLSRYLVHSNQSEPNRRGFVSSTNQPNHRHFIFHAPEEVYCIVACEKKLFRIFTRLYNNSIIVYLSIDYLHDNRI